MLKKILSQVLNYEKKRDRKVGETSQRGSKESVSSVDTRRLEEKIPDPWDDPLM